MSFNSRELHEEFQDGRGLHRLNYYAALHPSSLEGSVSRTYVPLATRGSLESIRLNDTAALNIAARTPSRGSTPDPLSEALTTGPGGVVLSFLQPRNVLLLGNLSQKFNQLVAVICCN